MSAKRTGNKPVKGHGRVDKQPPKPAEATPGAETDVSTDDTLNPGLQGIDRGDARHARRKQESSVEDPLQDWPEGAASDSDRWLAERDDRSANEEPGE